MTTTTNESIPSNIETQAIAISSSCKSMDHPPGAVLLATAQDALEWEYRGEGAANIVLSYVGSSSPFLKGKVLRLQKVSFDTTDTSSSRINRLKEESSNPVLLKEEQLLWADWPSVATAVSIESLTLAYARDVMSPLLGHNHVDPGVSGEFLEGVWRKIHGERPSSRAEASRLNVVTETALLMSDFSLFPARVGLEDYFGPTISVEIKPKCGFLPDSAFIAVENSVKKSVSRFTMHQQLKLSRGQIKILSQYSPLDLFSGNYEKIYEAIQALFESPQNNLRVFIDGKIVFGTATGNSDIGSSNMEKHDEAFEALENSLGKCVSIDKGKRMIVLQRLISDLLNRTDILHKLLAAQRLDSYDIEGAILAYYEISKKHDNPNEDVIRNYVNEEENVDHPSLGDDSKRLEAFARLNTLTMEESKRVVRDYLISATAKDCSLMLTFQESPAGSTVDASADNCMLLSCPETGQDFHSKIYFLDLDLKPLKKMPYYFKLDQEIVRNYLNS